MDGERDDGRTPAGTGDGGDAADARDATGVEGDAADARDAAGVEGDAPADTERAKMLRGDPYDPSDPALVAARERATDLTDRYAATGPGEDARRRELLAELFGSGGATATVDPPFRCDYGSNIHVGPDFYANVDCVVLDVCRVDVGRNCMLGPGVHVYAATHPVRAAERYRGYESGAPVSIGDDVWIGGRAVVNPGVSVGDRSVVASGAVVVDDVPDDVVVAGNPASVVKRLD